MNEKEKYHLEQGKKLPIMEDFFTIQGEGFFAGTPAYFIRIGGCDVGCHWCDVKESWDFNAHRLVSIDNIINNLKQFNVNTVVITGGEPLIYNLDLLCNQLQQSSYQLHLETSGAYSLSGKWNWICLSPKKNQPPLEEVVKKSDELKVIIHNNDDFKWAEKYAQQVRKNCRLYLQPEWSKKEQMMPKIVAYTQSNPKWTVSLQIHKYMGIP